MKNKCKIISGHRILKEAFKQDSQFDFDDYTSPYIDFVYDWYDYYSNNDMMMDVVYYDKSRKRYDNLKLDDWTDYEGSRFIVFFTK